MKSWGGCKSREHRRVQQSGDASIRIPDWKAAYGALSPPSPMGNQYPDVRPRANVPGARLNALVRFQGQHLCYTHGGAVGSGKTTAAGRENQRRSVSIHGV